MHIDLSAQSAITNYVTLTQTIVPRPVAWLLTENDNGRYNLAPFSFFNAISSDPPMVVVSIGVTPQGQVKDTRHNLEQRPECVIHIAHGDLVEAVTASSASMARGLSEIDAGNLATSDMPGSHLPRLADCRLAYAARLTDTHMIKRQWIAFLELTHLYIEDSILGEDDKGRVKVMAERLDPIGRLGGGEYSLGGDIVSLVRPD